jgi:malate synthase
MQEKYININKLKVSESLSRFVKDELLKDTNISSDDFWLGFERTIEELEPKNRQLINFRETLQKKIDAWHIKNKSNEFNLIEYKKFLVEIGYLKEEGPDFSIDTKNVDDEITKNCRTTISCTNYELTLCIERS